MIEQGTQTLKLVDTHIKKTGGTSLLSKYSETFHPNKIYVYNTNNDRFVKLDDKTPTHKVVADKIYHQARIHGSIGILIKLRQIFSKRNSSGFGINELPADWEVISGHFTTKKVFDVLPTSEKYLFTAVIREPLERMISHYEYWLLWGKDRSKTSFEKFAASEKNKNFQTRSIGEFDHRNMLLGTTCNLDSFIGRVFEQMNIHPSEPVILRRLNKNPNPKTLADLGVANAQSFRNQFEKENSLDYTLYSKALEQN
ncbi:MAG: hypothetical protein WA152_01390 [Microgenomates group bacterium]